MNEKKDVAIEVKQISKKYKIVNGSEDSTAAENSFLALKDISFTLHKGDVVGIIGSNGSGKTTLLKILSQIVKPTSGEARFYGSVTSILEIGNNFHPDLTGRENIAIQLRIEKIKRNEFETYYDNIKRFSEIGDFFDQPVKFYSSGMFLRLAFSMTFHLSSDILILDEVLSVGDEGFRLKCQELLKMFAGSGKTILFVSHDRMEILELSNKCIWLEKGRIKEIGLPSDILGDYFEMHREKYELQKEENDKENNHPSPQEEIKNTVQLEWNDQIAPGNDNLTIHRLSVNSLAETDKIFHSDPILIKFLIHKKKSGILIGAFFFLQDVFYQPVMVGHLLNNLTRQDFDQQLKDETGMIEIKCTIPPHFLAPGRYYLFVRFGVEENEWSPASTEAFRLSDKLHFIIHPEPGYVDIIGDISKGSVRPPLDWEIQKAQ